MFSLPKDPVTFTKLTVSIFSRNNAEIDVCLQGFKLDFLLGQSWSRPHELSLVRQSKNGVFLDCIARTGKALPSCETLVTVCQSNSVTLQMTLMLITLSLPWLLSSYMPAISICLFVIYLSIHICTCHTSTCPFALFRAFLGTFSQSVVLFFNITPSCLLSVSFPSVRKEKFTLEEL